VAVIDILRDLSETDLAQLEKNANARATGKEAEKASAMLQAIREERIRRATLAKLKKVEEANKIEEKVRGLTFEQRVAAAFEGIPPANWERDALKALATHPGATTEELSKLLGYSGTFMNWFGHVCRDRQTWQGPVTKNSDGETIYSILLVDFEQRVDPLSGRQVTGWRLKPEALAGLRMAGIL